MARKRGGLAGVWDRNKKIIKPIATLAAGALTGGAGGALVGGLMGGLDREGKGGIGFDVGRGALGAATGYGMGKLGGALKSGVMSRLGAGGADQLLAQNPLGAAAIKGMPAASSAASSAPGVLGKIGSGAKSFLSDGKNIAALGQTAVGALGAMNEDRQFRAQQNELRRRELLEEEDRRRREAMDPARAQLLAMLMQRFGGMPPREVM